MGKDKVMELIEKFIDLGTGKSKISLRISDLDILRQVVMSSLKAFTVEPRYAIGGSFHLVRLSKRPQFPLNEVKQPNVEIEDPDLSGSVSRYRLFASWTVGTISAFREARSHRAHGPVALPAVVGILPFPGQRLGWMRDLLHEERYGSLPVRHLFLEASPSLLLNSVVVKSSPTYVRARVCKPAIQWKTLSSYLC
ncbi:hypothetical protein ACSQ67_025117 [Phaseolus vulgaris]